MSILQILDKLAATSSLNEKIDILLQEKDNIVLKNVFSLTLSPDINFWILKRPHVVFGDRITGMSLSLEMALELLVDRLTTRIKTGNDAILYYGKLLKLLSPEDAEVLCRVVERNLKVGVSTAIVNKIWNGLIPTYDFLKAVTDPSELKFPAIAQTKLDGMRVNINIDRDTDSIVVRSTGGNVLFIWGVLDRDIKCLICENEVWDGELLCFDSSTNKPLSRKVSNGILTKAARGTLSFEEAQTIRFIVWDIVDKSQKIPYNERLYELKKRFENKRDDSFKFILIDSAMVSNMDEVEKLFQQRLNEGQEGIIVKNWDSKWEPKRSKFQVKFKAEKTADLLVTGWNYGNGKFEGKVGSLVCVSSDEKVVVNVSGLKEWQHEIEWADSQIGKIIEVIYNAKISKKGGGVESLYLPRFSRERPDKLEANSSDEL